MAVVLEPATVVVVRNVMQILLLLNVLSRMIAGRVRRAEVAQETVESVAQKVRRMGRAAQVGLRCPCVDRGVRGRDVVVEDGRRVDFASRHECSFISVCPFEATADDVMDHSWEDHGRTLHLP